MRVPDVSASTSLVNQLQNLIAKQTGLQSQVSSGQRITQASDDPDAMSRVLSEQADTQQVQQWSQNADRALALSQSSYSAVKGLKSISDRAGELAVLGVGVNGAESDSANAAELNGLIEQAVQLTNSQLAGVHLFAGTQTDTPPFDVTRDGNGQITGVAYTGAATAAQIHVSDSATISPLTDGPTNQNLGNFINNLISLRDALQSQDTTGIQTAQTALQDSETDIVNTMSDIGATQARLQSVQATNQDRFTDLQTLTSADTDTDVAQTMVSLTQTQATYQAALQSGAQLMQHSLLDYLH